MTEQMKRFWGMCWSWLKLLFAWNAKKYAGYLAIVVCGFITTQVNNCNKQPGEPIDVYVPPDPPKPDIPPFPPGWIEIPPEEQQRVVEMIDGPKTFAETPAGAAGMEDVFANTSDAPTWRLALKGMAKARMQPIPVRSQGGLGICVGCAAMSTAEYTQAARNYLAKNGLNIDLKLFSEEAFYGLMRFEVHGNKLANGLRDPRTGQIGDGATGYWAAMAWRSFGVVPKGVYGQHDLTKYSESIGRKWGNEGIPAELETVAKKHPGMNVTQVKTLAEAKKALGQGYFMLVCSNVGFGERLPLTRDSEGFLREDARPWGHAMTVIGYQDGPRPGYLILNSWGLDWVRGPKGKFGDEPDGSFWVDERTFLRMLSFNDTWALAGIEGFEQRKIKIDDWFVSVPNHPRTNNLLSVKPSELDKKINGVNQHGHDEGQWSRMRAETQFGTTMGIDRGNRVTNRNRGERMQMFWRRNYAELDID